MSVVSESQGGKRAPQFLCRLCDESLTGKRIISGGDGFYCEPCADAIVSGLFRPPVVKGDPSFRPIPIDPY